MPSSVDDAQIIEALRLTPCQRLERFDRSYDGVRAFANEVQPPVAGSVHHGELEAIKRLGGG